MAKITDQQLLDNLKELKVIDESKLETAFKESQEKKIAFAQLLVEKDLISDENLGKLLADLRGFPFMTLSSVKISAQVLSLVPELVAKKQRLIAFGQDKDGLGVGMVDPDNLEMINFLAKKTGQPVRPYLITPRDFQQALGLYQEGLEKKFADILSQNANQAKSGGSDLSVKKVIDTILEYADHNGASDVHLEPQDGKTVVRFRIDGLLYDVVTLPKEIHGQLITRVKVMANLRTDEHQAAQDGKLVYKSEREKLDVRVSIVPITEGEKVVMRLLSDKSRQFGLDDLGFSKPDLKKVQAVAKKPHGMILTTGPTGCGKTTTQYAILKLVNQREVNIMTIEDPVEYDIEGVNQIQVNQKTGLTFAQGLRSVVRQDPDVVLVGEIRDEETAGIAVNAAMTGHLVLSTLHTNDAATALPRLLDMQIEPFLVASTVNLIIAQRLVRKICLKCRHSVDLERSELAKQLSPVLVGKHFGSETKIRVYQGKGCEVCHQSGYAGRIGIYELLELVGPIREAIVNRKDAAQIRELAIGAGMNSMVDDGLRKVKEGVTTIEEVLRVTKE